jgi:hypothetical protein
LGVLGGAVFIAWLAYLLFRGVFLGISADIQDWVMFIRSRPVLLIPTEVLSLALFLGISVSLYWFRKRSKLWFGVTEMGLGAGTAFALLNEILISNGNDAPSRKLAVVWAFFPPMLLTAVGSLPSGCLSSSIADIAFGNLPAMFFSLLCV